MKNKRHQDCHRPLVPGNKSYRGAVRYTSAPPILTRDGSHDFPPEEKIQKIANIKTRRQDRESKTLVFSSSITRDIKKRTFNTECQKSEVVFHEFKGKRAKDIVRYMIPHLEDEQPSSVVLLAGGNDLAYWDMPTDDIRKVANCLVEGGLLCKEQYGVNEIFISSIMPRSHSDFQGNRHRLNKMLKEMCSNKCCY